jgi:NAD(P)-dependent dehydrogenase (short-subunit alcohol dehydrogenase family)
MGKLDGKAALVTGGSRGIGAAITRRLATDGADVAFTYVNAADSAAEVAADIERAGRRGLAIEADAADPDAAATVEQAVAELGRLDILVNNAGVFPTGPIEEVSLEEVDRTLALHTRAPYLTAQAAVRHMGAGGRIISIGSCFVERVPYPGISLYAMSKAALTGLTKGLARDLGDRGISVTLVHPGSTDTDMNPADAPEADAERGYIALGDYARPEEIAATVAHLAGDEGRYLTGTAIAVDGGFAA